MNEEDLDFEPLDNYEDEVWFDKDINDLVRRCETCGHWQAMEFENEEETTKEGWGICHAHTTEDATAYKPANDGPCGRYEKDVSVAEKFARGQFKDLKCPWRVEDGSPVSSGNGKEGDGD